MNEKEYIVFQTRSGLKTAMNEEIYKKLIQNEEKYYQVEEHIVAEQYFPQIIQFCITMIMLFNGYTSFVSILLINLISGVGLTLLWNNTSLYKIPGLSFVSLLIGNYIFRLFLHFIAIAILAFTYFSDWKILIYCLIAGFITQIIKSWFGGYIYTYKHNNEIANYVLKK